MPESLENEVRGTVISIVAKHHYRNQNVGLESEIYYDLNIYGDELYDVIDELYEIFDIDFRELECNKIAPAEGDIVYWLLVKIGFRPFKSFTVSDIVKIVMKKLSELPSP